MSTEMEGKIAANLVVHATIIIIITPAQKFSHIFSYR